MPLQREASLLRTLNDKVQNTPSSQPTNCLLYFRYSPRITSRSTWHAPSVRAIAHRHSQCVSGRTHTLASAACAQQQRRRGAYGAYTHAARRKVVDEQSRIPDLHSALPYPAQKVWRGARGHKLSGTATAATAGCDQTNTARR